MCVRYIHLPKELDKNIYTQNPFYAHRIIHKTSFSFVFINISFNNH